MKKNIQDDLQIHMGTAKSMSMSSLKAAENDNQTLGTQRMCFFLLYRNTFKNKYIKSGFKSFVFFNGK